MSDDPRQPKSPPRPTSFPTEISQADTSWDDDTAPGLEFDEPMSESAFDRVTAIPELPAELLAQQLMSEQLDSALGPAGPASAQERLPRLDSEPPVVSVRPLDPMALQQAPRTIRAASQAEVAATSATDAAKPTVRPPLRSGPLGAEPTGLELSDLTPPPSASWRPETQAVTRDPRDPVLELDLGEGNDSAAPLRPAESASKAQGRDAELGEMKDRYSMGDFTGALAVAEALLEADAGDTEAQRYAGHCREVLTQMYTARLGALSQRVRVAVPGDQIRWLSLDHRAGFVLSLIDGSSSVEELLDISGMNRLDALRILYTLYDQRVIALT